MTLLIETIKQCLWQEMNTVNISFGEANGEYLMMHQTVIKHCNYQNGLLVKENLNLNNYYFT